MSLCARRIACHPAILGWGFMLFATFFGAGVRAQESGVHGVALYRNKAPVPRGQVFLLHPGDVVGIVASVDADPSVVSRSVIWSSDASGVASVDGSGTIRANARGAAVITARATADATIATNVQVAVVDRDVFMDFQVSTPVTVRSRGPAPPYPDSLRSAKMEGKVMLWFVVDTTGRADTSTVMVMESTHRLFTQAARAALSGMTFVPAMKDGQKVRQVVETPFYFSLTLAPSKPPSR